MYTAGVWHLAALRIPQPPDVATLLDGLRSAQDGDGGAGLVNRVSRPCVQVVLIRAVPFR